MSSWTPTAASADAEHTKPTDQKFHTVPDKNKSSKPNAHSKKTPEGNFGYCRKRGLSDDTKFFCRTSYAQSTRKKSCVVLLHENLHCSLFTLQFPMNNYKLITYDTDHLYAFAYNYTIPVHPHISK